jgi:hypothetical protein
MAQYKHDRFFKFYIQSLYRSKGNTIKNIQIHNDEDLEIDLMFLGDLAREGWQEQNLGLFDSLMQSHPTIIVEHYSGYLEGVDVDDCITRKNLYWKNQRKELIKTAKSTERQLSKEQMTQIELQNPFTWILAVHCGKQILQDCRAQADERFETGVYLLPNQLRMGIVIIEQLPSTSATLWLKMLGNGESARNAFAEIRQLSPSKRSVDSDIMAAYVKYCVYLKNIDANSLTSEEREFMKTMEEIDAWYETQMSNAELKGKLEGKLEGEELQKQTIALNLLRKNIPLEIISEATGLTIEQIQNLRSNN